MEPIKPLVVQPPLRILGVIASPSDQEPVDIQSGQAQMKTALAQLEKDGLVELTWLNRQTWRDVQEVMERGPWHILHFIGHIGVDGTQGEGALALAHPQGNTHLVRAVQLSRLLVNHDTLRLVVLYSAGKRDEAQEHACLDIATTLTERGIPAVLAMSYKIPERAALELTSAFYTALTQGLWVDVAWEEARTALAHIVNPPLERGAPILRLGEADSRLFVLPSKPSERLTTTAQSRGIDFSRLVPLEDDTWTGRVSQTSLENMQGIHADPEVLETGETEDIDEIQESLLPEHTSAGLDEPSNPDATYAGSARPIDAASPADWSYPPTTATAEPSGPPSIGDTSPGSFYSQPPGSQGSWAATGAMPSLQAPELLQFTAFYPRQVPVEAWNTLLVYTHIAQALQQVQDDAARFEQELGKDRRKSTGKANIPLLRGTTITIVPACPGVTFNPSWFSFAWAEDWHRTPFRFQASHELMGAAANGEITIFSGPLIIGTIKLAFLCDDPRLPIRERVADRAEKAKLYQQVFSSYSHQDTSVVVACRNAYKALGMDVLIDIDSLRSGQDFSSALMRLIDTSDIFQLFWSPRSAQSSWVHREWAYALQQQRGEGFIRPVYWELPMPPPPPELEMLHFTYMPLPTLTPSKHGALARFFGRK